MKSTTKAFWRVAILVIAFWSDTTFAQKMYWTALGSMEKRIQRANIDGSDIEDILVGLRVNAVAIAQEPVSGKIYWTDAAQDSIFRSNPDGSIQETVLQFSSDFLASGIAVATVAQSMYWTEVNSKSICVAKLDGSNLRTVIANLPNNPKAIVVHEAEGRMYWVEIGDTIRRANLDGTNMATILNVPEPVFGMALDPVANKLYWAETSKLRRVDTTGANVQDIVTFPPATGARGVAVDVMGGKVYWYHFYAQGGPALQRSNLDGTDVETVITTVQSANRLVFDNATGNLYGAGLALGVVRYCPGDASVHLIQSGGFDDPSSLAIRANPPTLYWSGWGGIYRAGLDGTKMGTILDQLNWSRGLAIDPTTEKLYWTEFNSNSIHRANLDGTGIENVVTGIPAPLSVALDAPNGKLYWTESEEGKIQRSNLDGSEIEDLVTYPYNYPLALALDPSANKMFWTEPGIHRANLDGTQQEEIVPTYYSFKSAIAMMSDQENMYLYWTQDQSGGAKIRRSRLDGTGVEDVITLPGFDTITGLAFDCTLFSYSDLDQSGVVDLDDLGVVLNGFSDPPGFSQADLYPCYAVDSVVDLDDLIVLLESFAGNRPCADRCQ